MRKVVFASFQSELFIPDIGNIGICLPIVGKMFPKADMESDHTGLHLTAYTQTGKTAKAFVPFANIKILVFADDPSAKGVK